MSADAHETSTENPEQGRISGSRFVIGFVGIMAVVLTIFLTVISLSRVSPHQRNFAQAKFVSALDYIKEGNPKDAMQALNLAIEANPGLYSAYGWRGELMLDRNELGPAIDNFSVSIDNGSNLPGNYGGRGDAYLQAGLYAEAASDFTEAIRAYDDGTAEEIHEKTKDSKGPDPLRRSREQLERLLNEAEQKLDEKSKKK
ncbi:tetratricopeptide repeat protein [Calycomorphotria hydatis]|uniref:Tetratricopeptide repeat protein n=1 Tax=Calycomorphotria hydatis TaxID=2528027 RepID=A0A517TAV2_9PLAN|nr:tetratricopeptide repeat protein [Calycomorphotria hydatis]QDT65501.1 Tetratricopeptide repeat protein [Calycomorphotria hydatis]